MDFIQDRTARRDVGRKLERRAVNLVEPTDPNPPAVREGRSFAEHLAFQGTETKVSEVLASLIAQDKIHGESRYGKIAA